jgi:hypothetical protein
MTEVTDVFRNGYMFSLNHSPVTAGTVESFFVLYLLEMAFMAEIDSIEKTLTFE